MKFLMVLLLISLLSIPPSFARAVRVKGAFNKSRGTYVSPHLRTSPNNTKIDNWSTKGNVNQFTGKKGVKAVY